MQRSLRLPPVFRRLVFVLTVTAIAVVGSERIFWFWAPDAGSHVVGVLFYAVPVGVTLWAIQSYNVNARWSLLLTVPLYAYLTEGLLTPVLYSGGPFVPFFPIWFTGWHGLLSIYVLVFGFRRWLLAGDTKMLLAASASIGAFWGVWSSTLRLPENVEDEDLIADLGELVVLDPWAFAEYAATFTAILAGAHLLLNWVWPASFEPGRTERRVVGALVLIGVSAWTVVVPWALPMFAAYVAIQVWALRAHRDVASGPNLIAQLQGRFAPHQIAPLALIAVCAAGAYAILWELDPSELTLQIMMYSTIVAQTVVAAVLMVRSIRRARKSPQLASLTQTPA